MKSKKFITILMAGLLALSCFAFAACDEDKDNTSNNNNYGNDYDNIYNDEEWTDNH